MNYLNEWSPFHAEWCRNLAAAGEIPKCVVDETDIRQVKGDRLNEYNQCHFFAGIAGWPLALKLAGVPGDFRLWTGSCPCQPFSSAGSRKGFDDSRHLWPQMFRLIEQHRPPIVFGEQVASSDAKPWLDGVFNNLEDVGYACGAAVLPASLVGAPHERDRLWWAAADSNGVRQSEPWFYRKDTSHHEASGFGEADRLVDAVRRNALPFLCRGHDGLSRGVDKSRILEGYGNAIVPELAALFIREFFGSINDLAGAR